MSLTHVVQSKYQGITESQPTDWIILEFAINLPSGSVYTSTLGVFLAHSGTRVEHPTAEAV